MQNAAAGAVGGTAYLIGGLDPDGTPIETIDQVRLKPAINRSRTGELIRSMLELVGIQNRPSHPLDEMAREMIGLEIAQRHPLAVDNGSRGLVGGIRDYDNLRHAGLLRIGSV